MQIKREFSMKNIFDGKSIIFSQICWWQNESCQEQTLESLISILIYALVYPSLRITKTTW